MIETVTALENLDDIVKVDGIDAIYVGPADLSHQPRVSAARLRQRGPEVPGRDRPHPVGPASRQRHRSGHPLACPT